MGVHLCAAAGAEVELEAFLPRWDEDEDESEAEAAARAEAEALAQIERVRALAARHNAFQEGRGARGEGRENHPPLSPSVSSLAPGP